MGTIVAMTDAAYVLTGWGVAIGALGVYAVVTVARGRRLSKKVAPRERRWS
jgi:heme exporter protein D